MAFNPPPEVTDLRSFAEVFSWVVGAYAPAAGPGSLEEVSSIRDVHARHAMRWRRGTMNYGGSDGLPRVPGHLHVAWFLRFGAFGTRDLEEIRRRGKSGPDRRLFNSLMVGSRDYFEKESLYRLDDLIKGVPIPPEVAEWLQRKAPTLNKTDRNKQTGVLEFSPDRVDAAIRATRRVRAAKRQPDPSDPALGAQATPTGRSTRLDLILRGRQVYAVSAKSHLALSGAASDMPLALVATDGSLLAVQQGGVLCVARVNRSSGETAQWARPVILPDLGRGSVLAVDAAGSDNLVFVWANDAGTGIYLGRHSGGSAELLRELSTQRAAGAVLHGVRVLLMFPDHETGGGSCEAWDGLAVTSLVGATSNGRLVVLAVGVDRQGQADSWVEVDGRFRWQVPPGTRLELALGMGTEPFLRAAGGEVVDVSPPVVSSLPYEHWMCPRLIGQSATA